ncbi:MAG: site-specific integrase [Planctomycetota bacterium]
MKDWIDAWADDARRRGLSDRFIVQQQSRLTHLHTFRADRELGPDMVRDWLRLLSDEGMPRPNGPPRPCTPKTLNNHLSAVRKFFAWCRENKHIGHDPTEGIEWAKRRKKKGRSFSVQQVWRIFECAQHDEAAPRARCKNRRGEPILRSPYYRVMMATGMRAGAAAGLRVRDFQLDGEIPRIDVPAEFDKTRQERSVAISFEDAAYFRRVLDGRVPDEVAFKRPSAHVLKSDAETAGVVLKDHMGRGVGFHCFRRWHARQLQRAKVDAGTIQDRLGHSSILTTMDYFDSELHDQQLVAEELTPAALKSSGILLDTNNRTPDDALVTNGLNPNQTVQNVRAQIARPPFVTDQTPSDRPASGLHKQLGKSQPGRLNDQEPDFTGTGSEVQWAQQDSNL